MPTISEFLATKRDGSAHSPEHLRWFVDAVVAGQVSDAQIGAWLSSSYIQGLNTKELAALTSAMATSGKILSLNGLPHPIVDKHSTGGVGDCVTFLLLPILAACGVTMVKLSGAGLGFTGGTLDKAASIPGFRTDLSMDELIGIARKVGCSLGGQTVELAPADKIFYSLRSETNTVSSIPLIAASVMSKKLAANSDAIVLDVKAGSGAFMKSVDDARELATTMVEIGRSNGKKMAALVTDMNQPLAESIGNALEVRSAILELKSGCNGRLGQVSTALAEQCLVLADREKGLAAEVLQSGAAVEKLREWVEAHGGDPRVVDEPDKMLCGSPLTQAVFARVDGVVCAIDGEKLGEAARQLGAGRYRKTDSIDFGAGIQMHVALGDTVRRGDPLCTLYSSNEQKLAAGATSALDAVLIGEVYQQTPMIHAVIQ